MNLRRTIAYVWVAPVTLCSLQLVILGLATGGRAAVMWGVVEVHGGLVTWLLRRGSPWLGQIAAMTLGHVILGRDQECLDRSRFHEHVHVRQYERWGRCLYRSIWGPVSGAGSRDTIPISTTRSNRKRTPPMKPASDSNNTDPKR